MGKILIKQRPDNAGGLLSMPMTSIFVSIGMFTVSWDSLFNVNVSSFNVKIPIIAFFIAGLLGIFDPAAKRKLPLWVYAIPLLMLACWFCSALAAQNMASAMVQMLTVILGALIPFWAVSRNMRTFDNAVPMLNAFIAGAVVAALFGFYQLVAFYTGLPQLITYEDLGGGIGRIRAFNYESAFFGYFMILAIVAVAARERLKPGARVRLPMMLFFAALLLANTRASVFTIPLVVILLLSSRGGVSRARRSLLGFITAAILAIPLVALAVPEFMVWLRERVGSTFDPQEMASNAQRLLQYQATSAIAMDHPVFGIGGANLIEYAEDYGWPVPPGWAANAVIANNIWIQAALDGGAALLVLHAVLLLCIFRTYRRSQPAARMLLAGLLVVIIVGGALTSNFYDVKLWVILAAALAVNYNLPGVIAPIVLPEKQVNSKKGSVRYSGPPRIYQFAGSRRLVRRGSAP